MCSKWAPVKTTRRRPRSPALGRFYTQLPPNYSQEPPPVRLLSYCPVPSSCIWLLHPHRTTTFCHHKPGNKDRHHTTAWRSCAGLHASPEGGHIPPKPNPCFSLFTRQWQCLSALGSTSSQKLPKTQGKTAGNAKMCQEAFTKGLLTSSKWLCCCQKLSTSGFGSEMIPNIWKKFSVFKNKEKTQCQRFCLSVVCVQWFKPSPQWAALSTRDCDLALLHLLNKGSLLQEPLHLHGHSKFRQGTHLWSINPVTLETTTEGSPGWQFSKHSFKQCFHHSSRSKAKSKARNSIQAKLRVSNTPNTKHPGWWRYLNIISISIIKLLMIFLHRNASSPQSLLHQHPPQKASSPLPNLRHLYSGLCSNAPFGITEQLQTLPRCFTINEAAISLQLLKLLNDLMNPAALSTCMHPTASKHPLWLSGIQHSQAQRENITYNTHSLIITEVPEIWRTLELRTELSGKNFQPYQLQTIPGSLPS